MADEFDVFVVGGGPAGLAAAICQSGQIMSAAALLAKKPKPTNANIDEAMTGNICRCGTYQRIRAAIHRAAGQLAPAAARKAPTAALRNGGSQERR